MIAARELPLHGYGIADLVCVLEPAHSSDPERSSFIAFEVKMKDWRGALAQASRYKYYANASIVVLPSKDAALAKSFLRTFQMLGIGLWTFDKERKEINEVYTPLHREPISASANQKALKVVHRRGTTVLQPAQTA